MFLFRIADFVKINTKDNMAAISGVSLSAEEVSDEVDNLQTSPLDHHQSQESHAAPTIDWQKEELANNTIRRD